jgi:hypothetical protein
MKKIVTEVRKERDHYLEEIAKLILSDEKEIYKEIIEQIYLSLEKTYSSTIQKVKKEYNLKTTPKLPLDSLVYHEDGKTLEERVISYNKYRQDKMYYLFVITRILITENNTVLNHLMYYILKDKAKYIEIANDAEPACEVCGDEIPLGVKIPIKDFDLSRLPPYHPDCECYIIYFIEEE